LSYRFLRDTIPVLNACIWTWSRLSSAPGGYEIVDPAGDYDKERAHEYLEKMSLRVYPHRFQKTAGIDSFLPLLFNALYTDGAFTGFLIINPDMSGVEPLLFNALYTDGAFTGFLIINPDMSGVDHFQPLDPTDIRVADSDRGKILVYQTGKGEIRLDSCVIYRATACR